MPFPSQILDNLAASGAHISIDAASTAPHILAGIVNLWDKGNGMLTIRNASGLPPAKLVAIGKTLGSRVTFVE